MAKVNDETLKLVKQWEGCILFAYDDFDPPARRRRIGPGDKVNGTLTIGYGHTGPDVKPGMTINQARADDLLRADIGHAAETVDRLVKVPLGENQRGALAAFVLNVGASAFAKSTLLRKLNAGNYDAVPSELMRWTKSKGKQMQGLVNRRAAEAGLWAKGSFVQSSGTQAKPATDPIISPEIVSVGTAVATGAGSSLVTGNGPVQWALAAVMVAALAVGLWFYIRKRREA